MRALLVNRVSFRAWVLQGVATCWGWRLMLGPECQGAEEGHGAVISESGIFQPKDPLQHSKSCFWGILLSTDSRS